MANTTSSSQAILKNYFHDLLYDDGDHVAKNQTTATAATKSRDLVQLVTPANASSATNEENTLAAVRSLPQYRQPPAAPTLLSDQIFTPLATPQQDIEVPGKKPEAPAVEEEADGQHDSRDGIVEARDELIQHDVNDGDNFFEAQESIDPALLQWADNHRPRWAQSDFDALLLQVDHFTVAVPLITLGHIQPITDAMTPIFGQAPWFMGMQSSANSRCRVVNTALFIMPERYNPSFPQTAKYVVSINGLSWALAVSKVNQPIRLGPDGVRWRKDRSTQPWAAGVVKEHMCVLIDIPRLGKMLLDSDQNSSPEPHG